MSNVPPRHMLTHRSIDIYIASEKSVRPVYPMMHGSRDLVADGKYLPDKHAVELSNMIGPGLVVLASIDQKLLELYLQARDVTIALDQYHRGAEGRPLLSDLLDARNRTQHAFCSLLP